MIGEAQPLVVPLPEPWPTTVQWTLTKLGARTRETGGVEPPTDPSELLVFAASTGRLVGRTRFEPEGSGRTLRLGRGEYEAVATGLFMGPEGLEALRMGPLWSTRVRITDAPVEFARAALQATVAPVQRPELELSGITLRDLHGATIFADRR